MKTYIITKANLDKNNFYVGEQDSAQTNCLVKLVGEKFRSFGGGQTSNYNPLVNALSDRPLCFAAGVDIKEVVEFITEYLDK